MLPDAGSCVVRIAGDDSLTQVESFDWSEPSLVVATSPSLSTTPVFGQSPPVAFVVCEVMCTVKVEVALAVFAGTVTGPQSSSPAVIAQVPAQPAPCASIDQDRPALVGRVSLRVTPLASPLP